MVVHAFTALKSDARAVHGLVSNWFEGTMLAMFINVSYLNPEGAAANVDSLKTCLALMEVHVIAKTIPMLWLAAAYKEYIDLMKIILMCEEDIFKEIKHEFETCKVYWEEWGV